MQPTILTSAYQADFLTSTALQDSELQLRIARAEQRVLSRYTENGEVKLKGYEEQDPQLMKALRLTIALLVEHDIASPDAGIVSVSQGERSVRYKETRSTPSYVWAPLFIYDDRDPIVSLYY